MPKAVANKAKTPHRWPKGVSGNPAGAPKRGESWAEIIQRIGEMTDAEFVKLKHAQPTQKQQAVMAVYMALKNDPQPGVFNAIMERTEGKVPDKLLVDDWRAALQARGIDSAKVLDDVVENVMPKLIEPPATLPLDAALQEAETTDVPQSTDH